MTTPPEDFDAENVVEEPITFEVSTHLLMGDEINVNWGKVMYWLHHNANDIEIIPEFHSFYSTIVFSSREKYLEFINEFPELLKGHD